MNYDYTKTYQKAKRTKHHFYGIVVLKRIRYAKVIPLPGQSQCASKFKRANRISQ